MNQYKIRNSHCNYFVFTIAVLLVALLPVQCISVLSNAAEQVSMTTSQGRTMTLTMQTLTDSRGYSTLPSYIEPDSEKRRCDAKCPSGSKDNKEKDKKSRNYRIFTINSNVTEKGGIQ